MGIGARLLAPPRAETAALPHSHMACARLGARLRLCFLALGVVASGCAEVSSLRDLASLQAGLATEFQEPGTSLHLNNRVQLTITFQNSASAELPAAERAALARRVAVYVRDHYPGYAELQTIHVGFVRRVAVGPVTSTRTEVPYRFTPAELGPGPADSTRPG